MKEKKRRNKLFSYFLYDFVKITAGLPGLLFYRPQILHYGHDRKEKIHGSAILIANHIGFSDPIYLMLGVWYRRHHFVCMKEFFDKKVTGFFFKGFHCIPIDRENMNLGSFRAITDCLKEGKLVSMFPEGHVNFEEGETEKFKSGMVLMALMGRAPVIPVYIEERKNIFERLKICIGAPFDVTAPFGPRPNVQEMEKISEMLREKEEELRCFAAKER